MKRLSKLREEDGAYLIEAALVVGVVFALFFVLLIVLVNVLQTGHLEGLAQDALNYAIERCGTTFVGGWGRRSTLQRNLETVVRDYIRRNTSYTVVMRTPQNSREIRVRVRTGDYDPTAVTLYLDTRNGGMFSNQIITVERGGQLGQEYVRGMGDNP